MVQLTWEGKYDAQGKRIAPLRFALPFQTVETVNESAQQRRRTLDLFNEQRDPEWRNRLIWGDKKYVLPSLLPEFAGKVDLIYIDPPFATGADFSFQAQVGDEAFEKLPSLIEQKAYRDTWSRGLDSYLSWFYESALLLHELLSQTGSIYVHLDWRMVHYTKAILDEIFGSDNFRNEITWKRSAIATSVSTQWRNSHDTILFYTKGSSATFNVQFGEYSASSKKHYSFSDETGIYQPVPILASGRSSGETGQIWRNIDPNVLGKNGMHWLKKPSVLDELDEQGQIYWPEKGGLPRLKYYLSEAKGVYVPDFWDDINIINSVGHEAVGYPTQKPEALLERVIQASSNENDLVLDCFCGSGTTAAVAEKLNRRWITCDLGRFAIHTARKRLLAVENVRPFVVQNLGRYERQLWQHAEFGSNAIYILSAYRKFILDLYQADPIEGAVWLHGKKAGRLVHVGTVDSPITPNDVQQMAFEFRRLIGAGENAPSIAGIDVLGWDFALDINETTAQIARSAGVNVRFLRLPREILEKRAVEQGDIQFFELAALNTNVTVRDREVTVTLSDFMIPPDDVPQDVIKAVKKWSEWIDYWAVDWNYRDDTFHNEWQSYRTRKDRSLQLSTNHLYPEPGDYTIVVKVIDILGNDTTKSVLVKVTEAPIAVQPDSIFSASRIRESVSGD